jgi:pimeloyl-ACP methyl ester carboxylesterase
MVKPLFLENGKARLFGVFHEAEGHNDEGQAILLCPPGPQEYMASHWMLRRLASQLTKDGHSVLRFDYFGTGDSEGESADGNLETWKTDIVAAAHTLCQLTGADRATLVGYRLGASLAWLASHDFEERPRNLVLWQPVVDGKSYVTALEKANHSVLANRLHYSAPAPHPSELLGYPFSEKQRSTTEQLDLLAALPPNATRVQLIFDEATPEVDLLRERLTKDVRRFTYEYVTEAIAAGAGAKMGTTSLKAIVTALSRGKN